MNIVESLVIESIKNFSTPAQKKQASYPGIPNQTPGSSLGVEGFFKRLGDLIPQNFKMTVNGENEDGSLESEFEKAAEKHKLNEEDFKDADESAAGERGRKADEKEPRTYNFRTADPKEEMARLDDEMQKKLRGEGE